MADVADELAVRLYELAIETIKEELAADFPLVRRCGGHARNYRTAMAHLPAADRMGVALACVDNFHPRAMRLLNKRVTGDQEQGLLAFGRVRIEADALSGPRPAFEVFQVRSPRRQLMREATKRLDRLLGPIVDSEWPFKELSAPLGAFEVETTLDASGRSGHYDITYWQDVYLPPNTKAVTTQFSVNAWLGVSSRTCWLLSDDGSAEAISADMAEVCPTILSLLRRAAPDLASAPRPEDT